jgi:hypothetical protein
MRTLFFFICLLFSICEVSAFQEFNPLILSKKADDSVTIIGRFVWKNNKITGYPSNVKLTQ